MEKIKSTITFLLYLLAFALPWQTRWIIKAGVLNGGYFENGTISLYGTDILLIVILILFAINLIFNFRFPTRLFGREIIKQFFRNKTDFSIALIILGSLISIFFAFDKMVAWYAFIRLLLGVGLFYVISKAGFNKIKLIWSFIAGAALQAGLGIWQFFAQSTFVNKWLGLALHDPMVRGVSVVETVSGQRWLRAYAGLDHPNMLGGYIAIAIIFVICLILMFRANYDKNFQSPSANHQTIINELNPKKWVAINSIIHYSLFIILLVSLFFTFSRAAWIALVVGISVVLIGVIAKKELRMQMKLMKLFLAGSMTIFILFNIYSSLVLTRVSDNARLEQKSAEERISSYNDFFRVIKTHWLTGAGIGNYGQALSRVVSNQSVWYYQPVHNLFLLVWGETGLLGVLGLLGFLGWRVAKISHFTFHISQMPDSRNAQNTSFIISLSILASLIILSLVDHWLWSLHFGILLFWISLGISEKLPD